MNTIRVSNGLDPDQDRRSDGSDLGRNCLQRLSVASSKERVNTQDRFTFWGNLGRRKLFAEMLLCVLSLYFQSQYFILGHLSTW